MSQHMDALARANQIRAAKAQVKHELAQLTYADAWLKVADLIEDTDDEIAGAFKVGEILHAIPRMGSAKGTRVLRHCGIYSADRKIRELTDRQRRMFGLTMRNRRAIFPSSPATKAAA